MQSLTVEKDAQRLRPPQESPQRTRMPLFDGGERTDKSPDNLAQGEVVQLSALHIVAGRLVVDTGYVPFAGSYIGTAQGAFEAFFPDNTKVLLLFTTATVYTWSPTTNQWQLPSFSLLHHTSAGYGAGASVFALDDVTGLFVGQIVGVALDDSSQLITTITLIAGLDVTTADMVPVGRSVVSGAIVAGAASLGGDPQRSQISAVVFPGNGWVVFSNGIDPVFYYFDGIVDYVPNLPSPTTCSALAVFHEMLLLCNTTEAGTHRPWRVRASDAGDPTNWTTGIAATYDLLDSDDDILAALLLGPWLIIYRSDSIMRCTYLGILNEILFFEYMVQTDGVQAQGAVVDVGAGHVLVGRFGVYLYNGGYVLKPIGAAVFANFLAAQGDLNAVARQTMFLVFVPDLEEVWVIYPAGASLAPNKTLRMHLVADSWAERMFAEAFYAGGPFLPFAETTWASAVGEWEDTTWMRPWDSQSLVQSVPSILLSPTAGEQMVLYDYRTITDNGELIPWSVTTKELGDAINYMRWERAIILARGNEVEVEWSQDTGQTWTTLATLNFGDGDVSVRQVYIDTVSTRLMLRLSGISPSFELRYIDVFSIIDSEW